MNSNRGSSAQTRHEGNRFSHCFRPREPKPSLRKTLTLPILQTAGVPFRERIMLSGSSNGILRRRKRMKTEAGATTKP